MGFIYLACLGCPPRIKSQGLLCHFAPAALKPCGCFISQSTSAVFHKLLEQSALNLGEPFLEHRVCSATIFANSGSCCAGSWLSFSYFPFPGAVEDFRLNPSVEIGMSPDRTLAKNHGRAKLVETRPFWELRNCWSGIHFLSGFVGFSISQHDALRAFSGSVAIAG